MKLIIVLIAMLSTSVFAGELTCSISGDVSPAPVVTKSVSTDKLPASVILNYKDFEASSFVMADGTFVMVIKKDGKEFNMVTDVVFGQEIAIRIDYGFSCVVTK